MVEPPQTQSLRSVQARDYSHPSHILRSSRFYILFLLALFPWSADIGTLFATYHKYKFGAQITDGRFLIHDGTVPQIISVLSIVLATMSTYIGGEALSQMWAQKAFTQEGAGLPELETLGVFQSAVILMRCFVYLAQKLRDGAIGQLPLWLGIIISSLSLLLYPTALIALGTPTLSTVQNALTLYQYSPRPFMTNPGYGNRCAVDSQTTSCLSNQLAANAMTDLGTFDPNRLPTPLLSHIPPKNPFWMALTTSYSTFASVQVYMNLGPLNNVDMSSGAILFGQNFATMERLLKDGGMNPPPRKSVFDSVAFQIDVNTTTPFLTSQCTSILNNSAIQNVTIRSTTYHLAIPVQIPQDDFAVGQVTTDNMTLILSFKPENNPATIHCAISLGLQPGRLYVNSLPSIHSFPYSEPWTEGDFTKLLRGNQIPILDFANLWLLGMGWSVTAAKNSVSVFLCSKGLSVGTGVYDGDVLDKSFAEYYTLAILGGGMNIGFAPEVDNGDYPEDDRSYQATKTQFYLGSITPIRIFWIIVVLYNFIFVFGCFCIILVKCKNGWLPDWTDSLALLGTGLGDAGVGELAEICPKVYPENRRRSGTRNWKLNLVAKGGGKGRLHFECKPPRSSDTADSGIGDPPNFTQTQDGVQITDNLNHSGNGGGWPQDRGSDTGTSSTRIGSAAGIKGISPASQF